VKHLAAAGLILLLASPLVTWPGSGYDTPRLPVVALGAAALMAAGAWRSLRGEPDPRPGRAWAVLAGLFLAAHALSLLAAINAQAAVAALLPVAAGLALFWALARGWVPREHAPAGVAVLAIAFAAVGLGQWAWSVPAVSTIGNTNYSGGFAAILACFCAGAAVRAGPGRLRLLCGAAAALAAALVAASDSRAGMVGLGAGVIAIALSARGRVALVVCALALAASAAALAAHRRSPLNDTSRVRIGLWKGAAGLAAAHPVVGCGAGNFRYAIPPHRDDAEFELSNRMQGERGVEAREPHSTPLLVLSEKGPLGLAAFLGLLGLGLWRAFTLRLAAPLGGLAAFAAAGLFNSLHEFSPFDLVAGAMLGLAAAEEPEKRGPWRPEAGLRGAGALAAVALLVLSSLDLVAERRFVAAMETAPTAQERLIGLQRVLAIREGHWEARYQVGYVLMAARRGADAAREFERVLRAHPNSLNALNSLGVCRAEAGDAAGAVEALRRAESLQPNYWMTLYNLGIITQDRERILRASQINPRHGKSYYFLGSMALATSRREAAEWFRKAKASGVNVAAELRAAHPELERDPLFDEWFREEKKP